MKEKGFDVEATNRCVNEPGFFKEHFGYKAK